LFTSNAADLTSARVFSTEPSVLSPASPFHLTEFSPGFWALGQPYPSLAALDVNLPPGDVFGFLIEGGELGSRLALLQLPVTNLFTEDVPYFTNNAFSQLNGLDTTSAYNISWNGYTPAAGVNDSPIFFSVSRVSDGQFITGTVVGNSVTSFAIPANTFAPATQYRADLAYSSRLNTANAGFVNAGAGATFDLVTNLYFTTGSGGGSAAPNVPEPASAMLLAVGLGAIIAIVRVRRWLLCSGAVAAALLAACPLPVEAAIDFYRMGKTVVYQQTSGSQPSTPTSVYGGVDMFTSTPADIGSARVFSTTTMPPSPVPEFVLTEFSPGYWGSSQNYASIAEMDTDLPPGDTFGYLIEGGSLGPQLALLPLPSTNLFAINAPFFTESTFSQLSDMDPTLPLTVTWNNFLPAAGVNDAPIFFNVYRVSDGQSMIGTVVDDSVTSFQIPANTLTEGTAYRATLDFSSRVNMPDAGFIDANAGVLFDAVTELPFTTSVRLAGDYNRDDIVNAADYVVWRRTLGQTNVPPYSGADGDGDGDILTADYGVWRANFGMTGAGSGSLALAIPEAAGISLFLSGMYSLMATYRLRQR